MWETKRKRSLQTRKDIKSIATTVAENERNVREEFKSRKELVLSNHELKSKENHEVKKETFELLKNLDPDMADFESLGTKIQIQNVKYRGFSVKAKESEIQIKKRKKVKFKLKTIKLCSPSDKCYSERLRKPTGTKAGTE